MNKYDILLFWVYIHCSDIFFFTLFKYWIIAIVENINFKNFAISCAYNSEHEMYLIIPELSAYKYVIYYICVLYL